MSMLDTVIALETERLETFDYLLNTDEYIPTIVRRKTLVDSADTLDTYWAKRRAEMAKMQVERTAKGTATTAAALRKRRERAKNR